MSELTHINCVALTARFPAGKPVRARCFIVSAQPPGKRRFGDWGLFPFPRSLTPWRWVVRLRGKGIISPQGGNTVIPQNPGKTQKKNCGTKGPQKGPQTLKKGPRCLGFFLPGPPPPSKKTTPKNIKPPQVTKGGGKTPPGGDF
eukprot:FR737395.1.p1 GENE.FR737395.1~~FR737395.1.p1  ORF type:complete len:144 (+),score=51.50 FR737395.1:688-1119(+)